jgi:D-alanine-D-alanine ligase
MAPQKNLLLLCGGISAEHEISLNSARFVAKNIDTNAYQVFVVIVGRDRTWRHIPMDAFLNGETDGNEVALARAQGQAHLYGQGFHQPIAIAFPIIHGPSGEDGTIQGVLEYAGIPYVGNGVAASGVTMDKIFTKQILQAYQLPVVPFIPVTSLTQLPPYGTACALLNSKTLVIKPAALGSSVGIAKVSCEADYIKHTALAFGYSNRILIECAINGAEVECAVLGNDHAIASGVGEIVMNTPDKMYSYQAKYQDPDHILAQVLVTARLDANCIKNIQEMSLKAFHALTCSGLARIDFFVTKENIYINEINTMPGCTNISLYPQLWSKAGISHQTLIAKLLDYANERFDRMNTLHHWPDAVLQQPPVQSLVYTIKYTTSNGIKIVPTGPTQQHGGK